MISLVKDVMTTDVVSVQKDASYEGIAAALHEHRISAVPVLDEESKVVGVVSESDLLAKLALEMGNGRGIAGIAGILPLHQLEKAKALTAEHLMTTPACTATAEDSVVHAARMMYKRKVKRLPVVDSDGQLAGIVSRIDLLSVYTRSDDDIAAEIRNELFANEPHVPHGPFLVSVLSGVVTISGKPLSPGQRWKIAAEARHLQGVVALRDRMTHPGPLIETFDNFDEPADFPG